MRTDLSRRQALVAGAFGTFTLADLLRAEAAAGVGSSTKAVINVHLDGGPPQMDTIDPKPDAPEGIRGEFRPIATKLPGVRVCELMPRLAGIADKVALVRALVGSVGVHDAFQCQSGFSARDLQASGGRPALGCVLAKLRGSTRDVMPSFVDLMQGRPLVRNSARPGFLGPSYQPFRPDISKMFPRELEAGMKRELAARGADHAVALTLSEGLDPTRVHDRARLTASLDRVRREADASGMMEAMDRYSQQALTILTSGRFAAAMDLSKEPDRVLARYTPRTDPDAFRFYTAEDGQSARKLLLARRLVEAGVRCVSVSFSDFDTHSKNFPRLRQLLPIIDHALHALITDLDERGMLRDVSVVVWGEFGRTPRVNKDGGRDHWPQVGPAILAGGGMKVGQVIGSTDANGGAAVSGAVRYQDVFATLYHNLGINPDTTTLNDASGRPQHLLDAGQTIRALV
ncbi:MAG: DUF1501 domain-containing protein [Gemmataceae bacterium]